MVTSIEQLRKLAEMNLCERCFVTYKEIIEPTVRNYLFSPLEEWRRVESEVFQITMRVAGAYKTQIIVSNIDESNFDRIAHLVDKDKYFEIKRLGFKRRIDYLHKQVILGDASQLFLDEARKVRNKIHTEFSEFSEKDLAMLNMASVLTSNFYFSMLAPKTGAISTTISSNAEKLAKELCCAFGISASKAKKCS